MTTTSKPAMFLVSWPPSAYASYTLKRNILFPNSLYNAFIYTFSWHTMYEQKRIHFTSHTFISKNRMVVKSVVPILSNGKHLGKEYTSLYTQTADLLRKSFESLFTFIFIDFFASKVSGFQKSLVEKLYILAMKCFVLVQIGQSHWVC